VVYDSLKMVKIMRISMPESENILKNST